MASTYFFVILVFSVVPFVQSTAVEKRGLESILFIGPILQNAVNTVTNVTKGITSLLGGGVTQAKDIVQNYTVQATAVNAAAQRPLESLLQTAVDKIKEMVGNELQFKWNSTLCAVGQKESAASVVHQAVINTSGCIQTEIQGALQIFADITTVNNHAVEVSRSIPGQVFDCVTQNVTNAIGCVQEISAKTAAKLLLLLLSQVNYLFKLAAGGIQLPDRLTKCAADQLLKATSQVGGIISNVGRCSKQVAQNS